MELSTPTHFALCKFKAVRCADDHCSVIGTDHVAFTKLGECCQSHTSMWAVEHACGREAGGSALTTAKLESGLLLSVALCTPPALLTQRWLMRTNCLWSKLGQHSLHKVKAISLFKCLLQKTIVYGVSSENTACLLQKFKCRHRSLMRSKKWQAETSSVVPKLFSPVLSARAAASINSSSVASSTIPLVSCAPPQEEDKR